MKRRLPIVVAALSMLAAARAPGGRIVLLGSEFQVNTTTAGDQTNPAVATLTDGSFVVVWESTEELGYCRYAQVLFGTTIRCVARQDCPPNDAYPLREDSCVPIAGIFGQRFDPAGRKIGAELRFDEPATANRTNPDVTGLPDGGFVVAWNDDFSPVSARIYDATGAPRGSRFELGDPDGLPAQPRLASDSRGRFIIVWREYFGERELRAKRFHSTGDVAQDEFTISDSLSDQEDQAIAMNPEGEFVVVWKNDSSYSSVWARQFRSDGVPTEAAFVVEGNILGGGSGSPDVALYDDGSFVVVWNTFYEVDPLTIASRIRAQRFAPDRQPLGPRFIAARDSADGDRAGSIIEVPGGKFAITWSTGRDIGVRMHGSMGPRTDSMKLTGNSAAGYTAQAPSISPLGSLEFIVVWSQLCCEGPTFSIRGRQIRFEADPACVGDCNGDGVVSIDELLTGVNIALGNAFIGQCPEFDASLDAVVSIDELLGAVSTALAGQC